MLESIEITASSNVKAVSYDLDEQTLLVEFNSGSVYSYKPVPGDVAYGFRQALSAGQYFNQFIKGNSNYTYSKVGG